MTTIVGEWTTDEIVNCEKARFLENRCLVCGFVLDLMAFGMGSAKHDMRADCISTFQNDNQVMISQRYDMI